MNWGQSFNVLHIHFKILTQQNKRIYFCDLRANGASNCCLTSEIQDGANISIVHIEMSTSVMLVQFQSTLLLTVRISRWRVQFPVRHVLGANDVEVVGGW